MKNKLLIIFGWILLAFGIFIIGWAMVFSYNIFTAKVEAPDIFKIETKKELVPAERKAPVTPEEMQAEIEKIINEQLKEFIPDEVIPKMLNLISWSILAFILIFGGGKICGIAIKLLKRNI